MTSTNGILAAAAGYTLPLEILKSGRGYYIGTQCSEGPVSRESEEYFKKYEQAERALKNGTWTQRHAW
ncbi:TPA: hypothetical protein ACH9RZ_005718 [Escherichia coli]|uniref:Uncharacterized protein n=4 Tax=Enterobacteriaceae TaxID=543 RepID=D9CH22_ECOLX|nr:MULTISPECIES: hypothetical protein [Enterobacteriaceae]EAC0562605.1 hypothetical protein [Salmonella enterica subsp. enterica serovar Schwarzengrund]EAN0968403.1 hypothetical protein [Salmonella enterica subsp. enterica serovar 4,[5],12:i:-]EAY9719519.1 hypothetical protein [Salmonella enterica subsp. enterica serovar Infantis]EBF3783093.1 hypothetical protein [Salmonella enterica subsp. enterica serovar Reading]EBS1031705.1 hypothetical protein [Salmonella enterica subsp. enterica serovar 